MIVPLVIARLSIQAPRLNTGQNTKLDAASPLLGAQGRFGYMDAAMSHCATILKSRMGGLTQWVL